MEGNIITNALTAIPATDLNFQSALSRATADQVEKAIEIMKSRNGKDKGRIQACERDLRRRGICTSTT